MAMRTLEPPGRPEENPGGSGMPGTLDFAGGGDSSWATHSGTLAFVEAIASADGEVLMATGVL